MNMKFCLILKKIQVFNFGIASNYKKITYEQIFIEIHLISTYEGQLCLDASSSGLNKSVMNTRRLHYFLFWLSLICISNLIEMIFMISDILKELKIRKDLNSITFLLVVMSTLNKRYHDRHLEVVLCIFRVNEIK